MTGLEARDDEREARQVRLDHLLGVYSVGSGEWSWQDEYRKLIDRTVTQRLLADVREAGIKEPILLGTDGRVWDGHHRITVAMHLGIDSVPVEFAGRDARKHPEPKITAREEMTDFPVGTIARDMIGRVFVRTDAETYRWRTILGGGYDLSDEQATTYTPVRILWVPVGEGEQ